MIQKRIFAAHRMAGFHRRVAMSALKCGRGSGNRSYRTVHPAFNYDASNRHVVSIFIERLKVTISRDGNSYQGDLTWDSYDLQGNVLSDSSVTGMVTGTRIQVGSAFPFPFSQ
jgi:hypothetical protein